jgi:hypothetical protein
MKETCPAGRRRAAGRTVVRRHRVGDLQLQRLVRRQSVLAVARGMMSTKYRWAKRIPLRLHETRKRKQPSFANRTGNRQTENQHVHRRRQRRVLRERRVRETPGVLPPRLHREPDLQNLAGSPTTTTMRA